jgi:hypothetical protein
MLLTYLFISIKQTTQVLDVESSKESQSGGSYPLAQKKNFVWKLVDLICVPRIEP